MQHMIYYVLHVCTLYAMLCSAVLYCTILYYTILYKTIPYAYMLYTAPTSGRMLVVHDIYDIPET